MLVGHLAEHIDQLALLHRLVVGDQRGGAQQPLRDLGASDPGDEVGQFRLDLEHPVAVDLGQLQGAALAGSDVLLEFQQRHADGRLLGVELLHQLRL